MSSKEREIWIAEGIAALEVERSELALQANVLRIQLEEMLEKEEAKVDT